jgi:hypothetical protein
MQVSKPSAFETKLGAALTGKKFTTDGTTDLEAALLIGAQSCALEIGSSQARTAALAALTEAFNTSIAAGNLALPELIGEGTFKRVSAEKGEPSYKFAGLVSNWRTSWKKCALVGAPLPAGVTLNAQYQNLLKIEQAKAAPAANAAALENGEQVAEAKADARLLAAFTRIEELARAIQAEAGKTHISKRTMHELTSEIIKTAGEFTL